MTRIARLAPSLLLLAGLSAVSAQPSPQFKANVKPTKGSDGTTSTGTMYFGGAKIRRSSRRTGG